MSADAGERWLAAIGIKPMPEIAETFDVVVTVPRGLWSEWLREGELPGQSSWPCFACFGEGWEDCELCDGQGYLLSGEIDWEYRLGHGTPPKIESGDRVYIVAHGRLRGYAPLHALQHGQEGWALVRRGGARAVTIDEPIRGFQGWRYRWWYRDDEKPFPDWKTAGVMK